jgi:DNA-binding transcriptional MerR regulator
LAKSPRYTIRSACALTGVNANTLRSWERRYGLVKPERTPKGYRLYSQADLERLRLIQRVLEQGVPISHVEQHLEALERGDRVATPPRPARRETRRAEEPGTRTVSLSLESVGLAGSVSIRVPERGRSPRELESLVGYAQVIEHAAENFDRAALEQAFSRAVGLYSLRDAFTRALAPALNRIGARYLESPEAIAQEHFLSSFARERLSASLAGLRPLHQSPRVLCACAPGDVHDLMLMLLTLEIGLEGVSTFYLGADMPATALERAMHRSGVKVVALSATLDLRRDELSRSAKRLAAMRRPPTMLIGGPGAVRSRDWLKGEGIGLLPDDAREAAALIVALAEGMRRGG